MKCLSTSIELGFTDGFTRDKPPANELQLRRSATLWVDNIERLRLYTSLSFVRQEHPVCLEPLESHIGARHIIWGKQTHRELPLNEWETALLPRWAEGSRGGTVLTRLQQHDATSNCSTGSFSSPLVCLWGSGSEWPNLSQRMFVRRECPHEFVADKPTSNCCKKKNILYV